MGRRTIIVTNYGFNKPPMLSEADFKSFKQIFQIEPNFNMSPNKRFWGEFVYEKWYIIGISGGMLLGSKWDNLTVIAILPLLLLVFSMLSGTGHSMWNYQSFLNVKNKYYSGLKSAIVNSNNYDEFRQRASKL